MELEDVTEEEQKEIFNNLHKEPEEITDIKIIEVEEIPEDVKVVEVEEQKANEFVEKVEVLKKEEEKLQNDNMLYRVEDVKKLETYVSVENDHFYLDSKKAIEDGIDENLVKNQENYFEQLNILSDDKTIRINDDLSIDDIGNKLLKSGKTTSTKRYWWGYARYLSDRATKKTAINFRSASSIAEGVAIISSVFGPVVSGTAGINSQYWSLIASRLDYNNEGNGVYMEMTWAFIFDITPQ